MQRLKLHPTDKTRGKLCGRSCGCVTLRAFGAGPRLDGASRPLHRAGSLQPAPSEAQGWRAVQCSAPMSPATIPHRRLITSRRADVSLA